MIQDFNFFEQDQINCFMISVDCILLHECIRQGSITLERNTACETLHTSQIVSLSWSCLYYNSLECWPIKNFVGFALNSKPIKMVIPYNKKSIGTNMTVNYNKYNISWILLWSPSFFVCYCVSFTPITPSFIVGVVYMSISYRACMANPKQVRSCQWYII